jgi:hypothetical protein
MAAIKSQGALLSVSTAEAASDTITGITSANPAVVSSTSHGMANGTIVRISGVVGMTQVNDRAFVVANQSANAFDLKGIDATGYTTYSSGGLAYAQTMTSVGQVSSVSGFDGQADEIDVTHLQSTAKEFLIGLQDFGNVTLELLLGSGDTGQARLRALKASAAIGQFSITLSNGEIAAFRALVRSFTFTNPSNEAARGSVQLRVTGEPAWFA